MAPSVCTEQQAPNREAVISAIAAGPAEGLGVVLASWTIAVAFVVLVVALVLGFS